jgi:SAM-dependent methyltransferase
MRLDDPELVRAEFASEERLLRRRLDHWAIFEHGDDPREIELLALLEVAPERVLDCGYGPGDFAASTARRLGCDVVGVDQSERMVQLTRERGIDAQVGDVEALPFPSGAFDAAVANWVLHFLPNLDRGVSEIARVLRPGGRLCAITNSKRHLEPIWGVGDEGIYAENAEDVLEPHFDRVERRDVTATVLFATRGALRGYVAAFDLLGRPPADPETLTVPLRADCRWSVLVADKA